MSGPCYLSSTRLREALAEALEEACDAQGLMGGYYAEHIAADIEDFVRGFATKQLREAADYLKFTPLSERESGKLSDYTQGIHAAAEILRSMAENAEHVHGAWCHPSADGCPDRPGM